METEFSPLGCIYVWMCDLKSDYLKINMTFKFNFKFIQMI